MNAEAKRDLRNVMVLALLDGKLSDGEKQFIDRLRIGLNIDAVEFRQLVNEVRRDRNKIAMPSDPQAAEQTLILLAQTAKADGQVSDSEHALLERIAEHVGFDARRLQELLADEAEEIDEARMNALIDEIYADFARWDSPTRRNKIGVLAEMGRPAVPALLGLLESYRTPEGMDTGLELKTLLVERLGAIADKRSAYYLAQHINIGDVDDEISNSELRFAAAEALGRIVGAGFTRDQAGVNAARLWWGSLEAKKYDRLLSQ